MAKQKKKIKKNTNRRPKLSNKDQILFFLIFGIWLIPIFIGFITSVSTQFPLLKYLYGKDIIYGSFNISVFLILYLISTIILIIAFIAQFSSALSYKIPFKEFFKGGQGDYAKARKELDIFVKAVPIIIVLTTISLLLCSFNCTTVNDDGITKHYLIKQDEIVLDYNNVKDIEIITDHHYAYTRYGRHGSYNFSIIMKTDTEKAILYVEYFNDKYKTMEKFLSKFDKNIIHISDKSYEEAKEFFPYSKELIDRYR